jgi:hypothetical protein
VQGQGLLSPYNTVRYTVFATAADAARAFAASNRYSDATPNDTLGAPGGCYAQRGSAGGPPVAGSPSGGLCSALAGNVIVSAGGLYNSSDGFVTLARAGVAHLRRVTGTP